MLEVIRSMPTGVRLVLRFGFVLLAGVGLTLPLVINQAVEAPVSPLGLLWMLLLAYLVFTLTLILQRKQAAWMLSLGPGIADRAARDRALLLGRAAGALSGHRPVRHALHVTARRARRGWFSEPVTARRDPSGPAGKRPLP